MDKCVFKIASETLMVGIEANGVYFEQKKFNSGGESTLNLEAIQASLEDLNTHHKELVCYGKVEKQDLVSIFIRKENKKTTVVGRIRRINVSLD
jgi:hypothetical protein